MKRTAPAIGALVALLAMVSFWPHPGRRGSGALANDAYVWQRVWTEQTDEAVSEHAAGFGAVVALKAEVRWQNAKPHVVRVPLDYPVLLRAGRPIGLALRIGPYAGPFRADDERVRWLTALATDLVREAATNQLTIAELQIDFDCAESKLDGYRLWVEAIRHRVAPVPVTITALPAWLRHSACERLIAETDGWVLQVHSLERPRDAGAPFTLCDPSAARRAVEQAGRMGKPFRVALPTYGYSVAFDARGRFGGLSGEGPERVWPEGTQLREVRADPATIAALVRSWMADRPESLAALIWYRLPVAGDTLNWSWPTLAAVMAGTVPQANLRAEVRKPQPKLAEIDLVNGGQADYALPSHVTLRWKEAQLVAADAVQGFELAESSSGVVHFKSPPGLPRLEAGQRLTIGWVRLSQDAEVQIELEPKHH